MRRIEPHQGLEAGQSGSKVLEAVQDGALLVPQVVVSRLVRRFTVVELQGLVQIREGRFQVRVASGRLDLVGTTHVEHKNRRLEEIRSHDQAFTFPLMHYITSKYGLETHT